MELSGIDFVRLEEQLNLLLYDPEIRKRRSALPDYVTGRLQSGLEENLRALGVDEAVKAEFLSDMPVRATRLFQLLQLNRQALSLSGRMLTQFQMEARADRKSALSFLWEVLLARAQTRFQQRAGISAKVWLNFLHCRVLPGKATLDKISQGLSLTPAEQLEFDSRVICCVFPVDEALRAEVHRLQKATGLTVSDFLVYAWISTDAWEAFYPVRREEGARKKTSQETLLKFVVGCGLDETEARAFMETAHSMFVVRRDLVVLAGIRCDYRRPMEMQEILDFFSLDRHGEPCYPNLYLC